MQTSTWRWNWVVGVYAQASDAQRARAVVESHAIPPAAIAYITPEPEQLAPSPDRITAERHPEGRWVLFGSLIGLGVGTIVGTGFLMTLSSSNVPSLWLVAALLGIGGAMAGAMFGLYFSGADDSLHALYEESGMEGKYLVAIRCHHRSATDIPNAQAIIRITGIEPLIFPRP